MIAPKGRLLDRRPGLRQSRDTEGGRSLPKVTEAILKTLKYSDHFNFPLTLNELHSRLISSEPCSPERVFGTLQRMLKAKSISQTGDYFYLPGRSTLVARRLSRHNASLPQLSRASILAGKLGQLPGVLAVYLTGSLAMANSAVDDDIDFMVITQNGRLWTTRLLLTIYTELLGLRRRPRDPHSSGKVCLNLYLTPESYYLPPHKQSLYTAYELIQAIPLYDPLATRAAILSANPWILAYLPNTPVPTRSDLEGRAQPRRDNERGRSDPRGLLELIEFCCYHLQFWYMRKKITREYITKNSAFFHPNDPGESVIKKIL